MSLKFECCGFEGAEDWERHGTSSATGQFVLPDSCCRSLAASFATAEADFSLDMVHMACGSERNPAFAYGCYESLNSWSSHNMSVVAGIALAVCLLQIFGTMFSCLLARSINLKYLGGGRASYGFEEDESGDSEVGGGVAVQHSAAAAAVTDQRQRHARFRSHN